MAKISQPIDLAHDEFANLFKKKQSIKPDLNSLVGVRRDEACAEIQMKQGARSGFSGVLQVSLASTLATGAFLLGLHLSGVVDTDVAVSDVAGSGFTVPNHEPLSFKNSRYFEPRPRVLRELKQTIVPQTRSVVKDAKNRRDINDILPYSVSVPVSVSLASIVSAAYGQVNEGGDKDFPRTDIAVENPEFDDWFIVWPQKISRLFSVQQNIFKRGLGEAAFMFGENGDDRHIVASKPRCGEPYQVQEGQSLKNIAQEIYGTPSKWRQLYYVNRHMIGGSPTYLVVGQILRVPCGNVKIPKVRKLKIGAMKTRQTQKRARNSKSYIRVKKSHGNHLITITRVRVR